MSQRADVHAVGLKNGSLENMKNIVTYLQVGLRTFKIAGFVVIDEFTYNVIGNRIHTFVQK